MKAKIIITCVVSLFIFMSCQDKQLNMTEQPQPSICLENLDGSITIQGRITAKNTGNAPLGVTTVNIKNKWAFSKDITSFLKEESPKKTIAYGQNKMVFVNKQGYYKITINKNDTLAIIPDKYLYKKPKQITGLTKSQILNIELEPLPKKVIQDFEKKNPSAYQTYYNFLNTVNQDSLITISGIVSKKKTKTSLENIYIINNYLYNTEGVSSFHFTDKYGQFNIKSPKNNRIIITANMTNYIEFTAKNDTVINLYL
ncbi:hypothetical protein [Myroides odoratimimus]|uniref:hypothetical protein n=1 Tax=Myroides odoratimimus TaxID=76832 RepID=UPI002577498C|nr:hypothetical protein [Myroides odoratimimus]MDM1328387.1 hypothetical protein [Myroides odoratimimus]